MNKYRAIYFDDNMRFGLKKYLFDIKELQIKDLNFQYVES